MTVPVLTLDGDIILADGVPLITVAPRYYGDPRAVSLVTSVAAWPWVQDLAQLAWAIESTPSRVSAAIRAANEAMANNMDLAAWEADPEARASYLREYDRLAVVAALWRRFIP